MIGTSSIFDEQGSTTMYTVKRIGIRSAIRIGAILSALFVVVPVIVLLVLDGIFKFWGIIVPPELLIRGLASAAFWAAIWGGITAGIVAILYNLSSRYFGGVEIELVAHKPPKSKREQVEID